MPFIQLSWIADKSQCIQSFNEYARPTGCMFAKRKVTMFLLIKILNNKETFVKWDNWFDASI